MEHPILVWNGSPENSGVCRYKTEELAPLLAGSTDYFDVQGATRAYTCIKASSKDFRKFAGISFDDLGTILRYNETLKHSCRVWK